MLTSIQLVLLLFIVFFLSRVYLRAKDNVISARSALFWTLIWVVAIVGILQPGTTTRLASFFGVGRGVDVILYLAISVLFYLVFRMYVMIEDLRRELTTIVRIVALKDVKPRKKKKRSSRKA